MATTMNPQTELKPRVNLAAMVPESYRAMGALERSNRAEMDPSLLELINIRVSQINGCAYCIDMHTKDARAAGETEQRIYALNAWRETPFFTDRERAALALAESITNLSVGHVPDDVFAEAAAALGETELAQVIWRATIINTWNRIAITTRAVPGSYQVGAH
jgi:AhpD family alkylhydroperoxidase